MMGFRFPSKKAIREVLAQGIEIEFEQHCQETSFFEPEYRGDGTYTVVGPDAYNNRKWYATLEVKDGLVVRVVD